MDLTRLHPAEQLVQVMDRIYRQGLTTTSGGNLSVRTEDGALWITPSGVDKGALTPGDIVRVAPDGSAHGRHRPSVELPFHQVIYRSRPDLRGIVHAHPAGLVAFSLVRRIPDTALVRGARAACGRVGMAAYGLPGSAALGEEIGRAFADGNDAVMLENHGAVAGGAELARAFIAFETLEHCARIELEARRLGAPVRISEEGLRRAEAHERSPLEEGAAHAPDADERRAREEIVAFVRRACARGLFTSSMGSVSVRLAGGAFLVTPGAIDRLHLEPDDLVRIEGGRREAGKRPDASVRLHGAVYARQPHAGAVILGCPPSLGAFAATAETFDTRTIPECYIVLRDVAKLPFGATFVDPEATAAGLTTAAPVAIVQNEGVIATGTTLLQAFDRLEVAEHSARGLVACRSLGERVPITEDQIDAIRLAFAL
ncbi:MAG TPA: class II aldolase/adducin family protein [Anaeromyxobacter sp.]|nr:class II aldolase/adducin family protein [Anaeromyxobacter sp.]